MSLDEQQSRSRRGTGPRLPEGIREPWVPHRQRKPPLADDEREAVAAALLALLLAVRDHDARSPPVKRSPPVFGSPPPPPPTRKPPGALALTLRDVTEQPVRTALIRGLRRCGKWIDARSGLPGMEDVAELVASRLSLQDVALIDILDEKWRKIGRWD